MALSPSRFANDIHAPPPPPTPPATKKRMVFEEEDGFMFNSMMEEAEAGGFEEEDLYAMADEDAPPIASSSQSKAAPEEEDIFGEETFVRKSNKEGKQRLVLEQDEGFNAVMEVDSNDVGVAAQATLNHDYTSRYSNLASVNLNYGPRYVELTPISAVSFDGKTVSFSRRKRVEAMDYSAQEAKDNSKALKDLSKSMLEVPYYKMVLKIKEDTANAKKQADVDATNPIMDMDAVSEIETQLWTDRYRPKKFTDLLGDERVHRSALLWLKEWDQCVFKDKGTAAAELKRERRKKRARDGKPGFGSGATDGEERTPDIFGRPHEKILLLCGPPGLGKTTLAHVLARQAGYQVLEVNASDDRTGKIVEERIKNALESTALTSGGGTKGHRPTCVVVDEIDGAGGGGDTSFVKTLVKLIEHGSTTKKYKGKGKKDRPLLRPIICICNDLYAPVLRPLRPLARIIRFSAPTNVMLIKRLRTICDEESLAVDTKNLTLLSEAAEGDLRSCLNTLQFIKRKNAKVDDDAICNTIAKLKDTGTSSTIVVDRLFKKPPRKKGGNGDEDKFVNRIVKDVQTCGEYEKISQGCFENYLGAKQINDAFPRILDSLDWLYLYDRLNGRLQTERDYELLPYVPYTFVPWYKLFSSHSQKQLDFPKADYEAYLKRLAHQEIVDNFALSIPQTLKTSFTGGNIASELLPLLNRIISPNLKPVNHQLVKTEERVVMLKLISTMLAMNISFVQDKDEDGQLMYKLEPQIDVFVHFDGKRATDIAASRYAVRHLVNREMDAERLRRTSSGGVVTTADDILAAYKSKPDQTAKPAVKDAVDFFGRAIAAKPMTEEEAAAPPPPKRAAHAVYRFHEGFSNAVRVTKRVADFMLV